MTMMIFASGPTNNPNAMHDPNHSYEHDTAPRCSFCGCAPEQGALASGSGVHICASCAEQAQSILSDAEEEQASPDEGAMRPAPVDYEMAYMILRTADAPIVDFLHDVEGDQPTEVITALAEDVLYFRKHVDKRATTLTQAAERALRHNIRLGCYALHRHH